MAITSSPRSGAKPSVKSKRAYQTAGASSGNREVYSSSLSLSNFINSGLSSSFDAIRQKLTETIGDNGEKYLHEAVDKITDTTSQVATWSKKNPIKLAVGVAALMAVSAFLVHTMNSEGGSSSGKHAKRGPGKLR